MFYAIESVKVLLLAKFVFPLMNRLSLQRYSSIQRSEGLTRSVKFWIVGLVTPQVFGLWERGLAERHPSLSVDKVLPWNTYKKNGKRSVI